MCKKEVCPLCEDSKYVLEEGKKKSCLCILRDKAKRYLGSIYADVQYSSTINFDKWDTFTYYEMCPIGSFKSMVKSFLLSKNMKLSHYTVMPYDVVQGYFENERSKNLDIMWEVDFLVIIFQTDPPNKLYGDLLKTLLDKRILYNRITWLYLMGAHDSDWFIDKYSPNFGKYIEENFMRVNINKITFAKGGKSNFIKVLGINI